jgi:ABC-type multidrug transport system ATPase subunit
VRNGQEADGNRSRRQQRLGNYVEFINELSAWDNLVFTGKLYDMPKTSRESRAEELLKMLGL